jgi:hypothetical protein
VNMTENNDNPNSSQEVAAVPTHKMAGHSSELPISEVAIVSPEFGKMKAYQVRWNLIFRDVANVAANCEAKKQGGERPEENINEESGCLQDGHRCGIFLKT